MNGSTTLSISGSEPFRQTLTSVERGLYLDTWQIGAREIDSRSPFNWSVRKRTLHGGKQEGVEVIDVDNGRLRFTVIPTRGMSVQRVEVEDVRLGWDSPVKELVHPQFVNLESRSGLGWLEGFNEWLVRCGLECAGAPGRDKFVTNTGAEAEMDLPLHGKIGNVPASEVEVVIEREAPPGIRIRGRVEERMFYGPKLELWTEIATGPGAAGFRVVDVLTNRGAYEQEFQLLYHVNYGPPLLGEGARFVAPVARVTPINPHAAQGIGRFNEYDGPTAGFVEQVYCLHLLADAQGQTMVLLANGATDRAVSMSYALAELPYFTLWKNTAPLEEGYVTGFEPGTGFPHNRSVERQFGRVPKLRPSQSRRFAIDYAVHVGRDAVGQACDRIASIQAGRPPQVDRDPVWIT